MPESEIFSVDMYRDKMIGSPDRLFLKNERRIIKNEKKWVSLAIVIAVAVVIALIACYALGMPGNDQPEAYVKLKQAKDLMDSLENYQREEFVSLHQNDYGVTDEYYLQITNQFSRDKDLYGFTIYDDHNTLNTEQSFYVQKDGAYTQIFGEEKENGLFIRDILEKQDHLDVKNISEEGMYWIFSDEVLPYTAYIIRPKENEVTRTGDCIEGKTNDIDAFTEFYILKKKETDPDFSVGDDQGVAFSWSVSLTEEDYINYITISIITGDRDILSQQLSGTGEITGNSSVVYSVTYAQVNDEYLGSNLLSGLVDEKYKQRIVDLIDKVDQKQLREGEMTDYVLSD